MTDDEFAEAKKFWLMFQANETFKAVHPGCLEFLLNIKDEDGPIFTKVEPVQGPRSDSV